MERWLEEALDCGLLGLSSMTNPWDKLDGERFRSSQLPSTYASWGEYRRLNRVLRRRGGILQSTPNLVTKVNLFLFLLESMGGWFRRTLRTTMITMADVKASPGLHRPLSWVTRACNALFGADLRWQMLPVPFEVYADGMDLVVFEELDYEKRYSPRVWHRDFHDAFIVECPDEELIGRSFGQVAEERGLHAVDAFLDLVVEHGRKLRWRMVIANHRPREVERMCADPSTLIGFADSGAHIRNMAFYNFPLRFLKLIHDAERDGRTVMPLEKAVWRVTGELAEFLGVDAGYLRPGDRADVVVVDPEALDERLEEYHEAEMEGFGLRRMVNRSDGAVAEVLVNGRRVLQGSEVDPRVGRELGYGSFLPSRTAKEGTASKPTAAPSTRRVA
jgi:N-acyl-D-aspartate/D-glutamate deacylase